MRKEKDIKILIERFLNADTTMEEEKALYDYFSGSEINADLLPMKDMFLAYGNMSECSELPVAKPVHKLPAWRKAVMAAAACTIVALISWLTVSINREQNYCEAYIYNCRVTDKAVVMREVASTMASINADEETLVDAQLRGIFKEEK